MAKGGESAALRNFMKSENDRLKSFKYWPCNSCQSPSELARAGLYYTGDTDRVKCPFCLGVLKKWKVSDIPLEEHKSHFPFCRYIRGYDVGNIPLDSVEHYNVSSPPQCIDDMKTSLPRFTNESNGSQQESVDFKKEENRIRSFTKWPRYMKQKAEDLARAGFYHIPNEDKPDRVQCGYCGGKLYNWEADDEPWRQHARCFPHCPYVKLCVGDLQQLNPTVPASQNDDNHGARHKEDDGDFNKYDDARQVVLEMGFPVNIVTEALDTYKTHSSEPLTAEKLASITMTFQDERSKNHTSNFLANIKCGAGNLQPKRPEAKILSTPNQKN